MGRSIVGGDHPMVTPQAGQIGGRSSSSGLLFLSTQATLARPRGAAEHNQGDDADEKSEREP